MKKRLVLAIALGCAMLGSTAFSSVSNHDSPTTALGPTLRASVTRPFYEDVTAVSLLGELGRDNIRIGGTLGWKISDDQQLKISAEYLWQNLNYEFYLKNQTEWVKQGAVGAGYEYQFMDFAYDPSFDLNAYYSYAPSETLSNIAAFGIFSGTPGLLLDFRRIAGSKAAGVAPGINFHPWWGNRSGIILNYDHVDYDTKYDENEDAIGVGGTIHTEQMLSDSVVLGLAAAFRKPFTNYEASINWTDLPYFGHWVLGVFGDYVNGKHRLPNSWNAGLSANCILDSSYQKTKVPVGLRDPGFVTWTAKPAVYLPQVLAIPDEKVLVLRTHSETNACDSLRPVVIGSIPTQVTVALITLFVPTAQVFQGNDLTFSLSVVQTAGPVQGTTISINTATGVVEVSPDPGVSDQLFNVTVTATNQCGSASTTFIVRVPALA